MGRKLVSFLTGSDDMRKRDTGRTCNPDVGVRNVHQANLLRTLTTVEGLDVRVYGDLAGALGWLSQRHQARLRA